MEPTRSSLTISRRAQLATGALLLTSLLGACRGDPTTVLTRLDESRHLAADIRVQFGKATDASNRAVMADTEASSLSFANEAQQATKELEQDIVSLATLLESLNYAQEQQLLQEFRMRLVAYQKLDSRILALAVENTNLKARALSLGPATEAAQAFASALRKLADGAGAKASCRVEALVSEAILAVREIQILHAPHIDERDDVVMTQIEGQMANLDGKARAALADLRELVPAPAAQSVTDALAALDKFKAVATEIVRLSRRNTNVLSLELALRDKPPLAAACDERLQALRVELAKEGPKASR